MLTAIHQRIVDWRRERRIRVLRAAVSDAYATGCKATLRAAAHALFAECDARSEAQKQRMERRILERMDPHARAVFERSREA
jgi:5-carboxymethyl-2-hydroxymuconate isomerase